MSLQLPQPKMFHCMTQQRKLVKDSTQEKDKTEKEFFLTRNKTSRKNVSISSKGKVNLFWESDFDSKSCEREKKKNFGLIIKRNRSEVPVKQLAIAITIFCFDISFF